MSNEKLKKDTKIPPTFLSTGYVKEIESGVYSIYRDMLVENKDPKTGETVREKVGKPVPIGKLLRRAEKGEENRVVIRSIDPQTMTEFGLVELEDQ